MKEFRANIGLEPAGPIGKMGVAVSPANSNRVWVIVEHEPGGGVYRSDDGGDRWREITTGLPAESVNVIREDPNDPDRLYIGTDRGVHVSLDGGSRWHSLRGNLPTTPVHDLAVRDAGDELIAGTHGRGVFVLGLATLQTAIRAVSPSRVPE